MCLGDTAEARPGLNVCSTGTIAPSAPSANSPSDASSGLQYRLAVPYILKIQEATPNCAEGQLVDSCWHDVFSRIVMAENRSAIYSIPIERAAFVTNTYHLTFTDGALTKNIVTKPSELLALMRLPLDVVDTILDIPFKQMERLTTRETKEQALYTAQKSAIDAQKEAITANRAFMDYMAANAKAAGGTTAPGVMQDPGHTAPQ